MNMFAASAAGIEQEVAIDELADIGLEGGAAGAGLACDGIDLDDGFLGLPLVADGVDRAVIEIDGVDLHLLFDNAVGFDLADRLADDVARQHRGLRLRRDDDGAGLGLFVEVLGRDRFWTRPRDRS